MSCRPRKCHAVIRKIRLLLSPLLLVSLFNSNAQDNTLVRSMGQSSPGMELNFDQNSNALQREADKLTPSQEYMVEGVPVPIWETAEAVALESMEVSAFEWDISITLGVEYEESTSETTQKSTLPPKVQPVVAAPPSSTSTNASSAQSASAPEVAAQDTVAVAMAPPEEPKSTTAKREDSFFSYFARFPFKLSYGGERLQLGITYTPEFRVVERDEEEDREDDNPQFNHSFNLASSFHTPKTNISLQLGVSKSEQSQNVETGERADSLNINSSLSASYLLSEKTSIGAALSTQVANSSDYNSFGTYTGSTTITYAMSPKLQLGATASYARSNVDEGASSNASSLQANVTWNYSEKLATRGSLGWQLLEFDDGNSSNSPIFSLGVIYRLSELTSISLDAYRSSTPSVSELNQSYYATGALLTVNQRLIDRFNISLSAGGDVSQYEAAYDDVQLSQDVFYWYVRLGVTYTIREKYAFNLYYQHTRSEADGDFGQSLERNLIGLTISYTF